MSNKREWSKVLLIYVMVLGFGFSIYLPLGSLGFLFNLQKSIIGIIINLIGNGLCVVILLLALKNLRPDLYFPLKIFFTKFKAYHLKESMLILVVFLLLFGLAFTVVRNPKFIFEWANNPLDLFLLVGLSVLLFLSVALVEEICFRGLLLRYTLNKIGIFPAILTNSLVFTVIHSSYIVSVKTVLFYLLSNTVICLLYLRTKRLYSVVSLHLIWNFSIYLFSSVDEHKFESPLILIQDAVQNQSENLSGVIAIIIVFLIFLILLPYITKKNPSFIEPPRNV